MRVLPLRFKEPVSDTFMTRSFYSEVYRNPCRDLTSSDTRSDSYCETIDLIYELIASNNHLSQ